MKVTFDNVYDAFQIIAPKGTMISYTGEPTVLADGVYLVGDDGIINLDEQFLTDTLYLSTEGTDYAVTGGVRVTYPLGDETLIIRAGSSAIPFSKGGKGGGSGSGVTKYKGTTTTPISNGSTTNPIVIDGEDYAAVFGDIAVYNYTEFVFDGTQWGEFGRPFDTAPTSGSANAVTSDGIREFVLNNSSNWTKGSGNGASKGGTSTATGQYSIAYGSNANASGSNSIALGYYAETTASYSTAIGMATKADKQNLVAVGIRNSSRTGDLFEVGNGTDSQHRSNILEANWTSVNVNGDIQRNGVGIDDYTTTERKIGKWIDGSDLYQRTFEVTGLVNGQWNNSVLGTSGINIVDTPSGTIHWLFNDAPNIVSGINYYRGATEYSTAYINATADDVNILSNIDDSGYTIDKAIITIKYTKPSAQANLMQTAPTENVSETPTVEEDDMR